MANDKIENAVERGGVITAFAEHGRVLFTKPSGGTWASDGLVGYTSSTLSIRRGAMVSTYNEKGRFLQQHTAGPPTPKVKPAAPARVATSPRPVAPPSASKPRNSARAPYVRSAPTAAAAPAPAAWWPASAPLVSSRRGKVRPITETEAEIDTAHFDFEDAGNDDDIEISEMTAALPDEVRGLILILERRRRRWKILAIIFMLLFSLLFSVIVLAIAVAK